MDNIQIIAAWGAEETVLVVESKTHCEALCKAFEAGWAALADASGGHSSEVGFTIWPRDRQQWDEDAEYGAPPHDVRNAIHAKAVELGLIGERESL